MQHYDYLIAGSGLAGLYAASVASRYGKVAVITKCKVTDSNTYYAQGGIAAVTDDEDTPGFHLEDTLTAGRDLCNTNAVEILVNEGPERIKEIIDAGMKFDMSGGEISLGLEGGHRKRRVLHAGGDITGRRIMEFMVEQILSSPNITLFENHQAIEILVSDNCCKGLRIWDFKESKEHIFLGDNTILALGGASAIYERTTNPSTTVGDGVALCYKAGCRIADMEFIQFHPTTIYTESDKSYLISEAVRGEGAHLLNHKGERFMTEIHPLAELAPRDVVAKAIFCEVIKELSAKNPPCVWLSLKHLDKERIKRRFPHIFRKCAELGIDMTDRIPVSPAAHYMVGGVECDLDGKSGIERLYVCGELASTGVMGANRLASNSLAECLVFGHRAVMSTLRSKENGIYPKKEISAREGKFDISGVSLNPKNEKIYQTISKEVAQLMMRCAGIVRDRETLERGRKEIIRLQKSICDLNNREYYKIISNNLISVASLIIEGALHRNESRGGHFRSDFPEEDNSSLYHSIQQIDRDICKLYTTVKNNKNQIMSHISLIDKIIDLAIEEDVATGDITTNSIILEKTKAIATFKMKADGVVSGIDITKRVFEHLDRDVIWTPFVKDGDSVKKEDVIVEIEGSYRCLLSSERIALNILQRMSGIATLTSLFVKELEGTGAKILDTRKTAPGLRVLDKMAVAAGGGKNHRMGLYDMVLIKDNHIKIAGGIRDAIAQVRENINMGMKIEVETTNLEEVREAVDCGADIIMLDNMDNATMTEAIEIIAGRAETEASGNMTLGRVREVALLGVNYISVGALTHSVNALDISMNVTAKHYK
ncbi:MAG: L-aspartate oxidase [Bacteroidales bacterium]|jgi:L-aspartate oxidase|nr:L-aspartate oxidase [Bacteroidales bacterium]